MGTPSTGFWLLRSPLLIFLPNLSFPVGIGISLPQIEGTLCGGPVPVSGLLGLCAAAGLDDLDFYLWPCLPFPSILSVFSLAFAVSVTELVSWVPDLHGCTGSPVQKSAAPGLMLCCCCLERPHHFISELVFY